MFISRDHGPGPWWCVVCGGAVTGCLLRPGSKKTEPTPQTKAPAKGPEPDTPVIKKLNPFERYVGNNAALWTKYHHHYYRWYTVITW